MLQEQERIGRSWPGEELADEEEFYLRIYITRGETENYVKSERCTMDLPLSVSPSSNAYVCIFERPLLSSLFLSFSLLPLPRKRAASLERARMQRRLVSLPRQSLADKSKHGDETNETTRPISRTLDGIVSSLGSQLATRFFSLAGLRTNCRGTTASVNDCAQLLCPATPPSFIPDKGKIGRERERGARPVEYANTATRKRWRNSKPVFRITFSLSSRQIRRPLSPPEGHLYSSFWRGRGREGGKNATARSGLLGSPSICHRPLRARPRKLTYERTTEPTCRVVVVVAAVVRLDRDFRSTVPLLRVISHL